MGPKFLVKRDFFGVYERHWDFLGCEKKKHRDFLGFCIFHQLKSTITSISTICCLSGIFVIKFANTKTLRDFLGMIKK